MTADDPRPLPPPPLHPDLDTLADLQAGALDPATAERVGAHAAGCPRCTAALAALDAVGADLAALPTPVMPAPVAARLDATLADLRRADQDPTVDRATTGATAAHPDPHALSPTSTGPGSHAPEAAPTGSGPVGGAGDTTGDGPTGSGPAAGDRPGRPADLAAARARRRQRVGRAFGSVAAALAVLVAGASVTAIVRTGGGSDDSVGDTAAGGSSGTDEAAPLSTSTREDPAASEIPAYDEGTLRTDIPQIVRRFAVGIVSGRDDTGPAGVMSDTGRRTACANTIGGATGELQAVQRIRYEGRPAYVFVFTGPGRSTAYVVTDDCGTSPALPASVLDTVS